MSHTLCKQCRKQYLSSYPKEKKLPLSRILFLPVSFTGIAEQKFKIEKKAVLTITAWKTSKNYVCSLPGSKYLKEPTKS